MGRRLATQQLEGGRHMTRCGRPTSYRLEFAEQARKLCLLGATNEDMAAFFVVAVSTVSKWLAEKAEFSEAVKDGRAGADATVAQRLYKRAVGYEHEAVKIVVDAKTGAQHIVPYTERYAPDTTACIFWLKNRRPEMWRDRHEVSANVHVSHEDALKDLAGEK